MEGFTQNTQCSSKHAESVQTIGSDKFALHSISPPQSGKFTLAKYFYSEDTKVKLPFFLRATYTIEANVAKILFKFEIDRNLKAKLLSNEKRNQHALSAVKEPSFEQIQIKINFPNEISDASLMSTHGSFKFFKSEE